MADTTLPRTSAAEIADSGIFSPGASEKIGEGLWSSELADGYPSKAFAAQILQALKAVYGAGATREIVVRNALLQCIDNYMRALAAGHDSDAQLREVDYVLMHFVPEAANDFMGRVTDELSQDGSIPPEKKDAEMDTRMDAALHDFMGRVSAVVPTSLYTVPTAMGRILSG